MLEVRLKQAVDKKTVSNGIGMETYNVNFNRQNNLYEGPAR